MELNDKVALVTGGASGIGKAIASLFAAEGASVTIADVNDERGKKTSSELKAKGGKALFVHADVSRRKDAEGAVEAAVREYGRLNILVNNAGIVVYKNLVDHSEEDWDRVLDINLKGIFLMSKYAIPHIAKAGGGAIVNIASVHGVSTVPKLTSYAASKAGVIGLTRSMALEFIPDKIRINCILPGAINTDMVVPDMSAFASREEAVKASARIEPMGRVGGPEEIAQAALFLASDRSSFATGAPFIIDGGLLARIVQY